MGRGAYEHNYTQLNLPELTAETADPAPVALAVPADLTGQGPAAVDLYCAENRALLADQAESWAGRFQLIYLDPPFNSNRSYNVLFKEAPSPGRASGASADSHGRLPASPRRPRSTRRA